MIKGGKKMIKCFNIILQGKKKSLKVYKLNYVYESKYVKKYKRVRKSRYENKGKNGINYRKGTIPREEKKGIVDKIKRKIVNKIKKVIDRREKRGYMRTLQRSKKEGEFENTNFIGGKVDNPRKEGKVTISEDLGGKTKSEENRKMRSYRKKRVDINGRETKDDELAMKKEKRSKTLERDSIGRDLGRFEKSNKGKGKNIGKSRSGKSREEREKNRRWILEKEDNVGKRVVKGKEGRGKNTLLVYSTRSMSDNSESSDKRPAKVLRVEEKGDDEDVRMEEDSSEEERYRLLNGRLKIMIIHRVEEIEKIAAKVMAKDLVPEGGEEEEQMAVALAKSLEERRRKGQGVSPIRVVDSEGSEGEASGKKGKERGKGKGKEKENKDEDKENRPPKDGGEKRKRNKDIAEERAMVELEEESRRQREVEEEEERRREEEARRWVNDDQGQFQRYEERIEKRVKTRVYLRAFRNGWSDSDSSDGDYSEENSRDERIAERVRRVSGYRKSEIEEIIERDKRIKNGEEGREKVDKEAEYLAAENTPDENIVRMVTRDIIEMETLRKVLKTARVTIVEGKKEGYIALKRGHGVFAFDKPEHAARLKAVSSKTIRFFDYRRAEKDVQYVSFKIRGSFEGLSRNEIIGSLENAIRQMDGRIEVILGGYFDLEEGYAFIDVQNEAVFECLKELKTIKVRNSIISVSQDIARDTRNSECIVFFAGFKIGLSETGLRRWLHEKMGKSRERDCKKKDTNLESKRRIQSISKSTGERHKESKASCFSERERKQRRWSTIREYLRFPEQRSYSAFTRQRRSKEKIRDQGIIEGMTQGEEEEDEIRIRMDGEDLLEATNAWKRNKKINRCNSRKRLTIKERKKRKGKFIKKNGSIDDKALDERDFKEKYK